VVRENFAAYPDQARSSLASSKNQKLGKEKREESKAVTGNRWPILADFANIAPMSH
jgi:hypothetical protein